jgi:CheY-like chemotaxis protein
MNNEIAMVAIALSIVAIAWPYIRRPDPVLTRMAEFISGMDGTRKEEIAVDSSRHDLGGLISELNKASKRLYNQRQAEEVARAHLEQMTELVDESPNIVLTMDRLGEIQYLNVRAKQLIASLGLEPDDMAILFPMTPMKIVDSCINNREVLNNLDVVYSDYTFSWTIKPIRGQSMLQAHASVNRRSEQQNVEEAALKNRVRPNGVPNLYVIHDHPGFRQKIGTVLVIDSDPVAQDLISRFLGREGYQVHCADSGDTGLELASRLKPDLITLDIMMPGKNGWIVFSALKDNPELARIPVVVISGVGNKRFVHAMGADDYVPKPVDWSKLGKVVQKLSNRFRSAQSAQ